MRSRIRDVKLQPIAVLIALLLAASCVGGRGGPGEEEGGSGGTGATFPITVVNVKPRVAVPCVHTMPCTHFFNGWPMHPYDTIHPCDWE